MATNHDLQPLLDVQQNQLQLLFSDSDSIDTKTLAILGVNIAALLYIGGGNHHLWWIRVLALVPFIVSLVFNALAAWPRDYIGAAPDPSANAEYLTLASEDLILQLLADTQLALTTNAKLNHMRWQYCLWSLVFTVVGLIVLFAIL